VGDNGHGKTNLLEAVAYLHLLRSVRGARDVDVVRFGQGGFHIRGAASADPASAISISASRHDVSGGDLPGGDVSGGDGPSPARSPSSSATVVTLGFERASRRKRVTVNGTIPQRLSDVLGVIPSVTFAPVDVDLVRSGPIARRRYLDVTLATTSRRYLAALQSYRAALLQRNTALRDLARRGGGSSSASETAVGAWEPLLAASGAILWAERAAWAARWAPELTRISAAIGERGIVHMRHAARLADRASVGDGAAGELTRALAAALAAGRAGDVRHGATRVGPHRDDLILTLAGRDLRSYGSAGQQRSTAIALRILEADTLRCETGAAPVLLFDDPFAELDAGRARAILEVLGGADVGQVVLVVPRAGDIPAGLTRLARYAIADGVLRALDAAA